LGVKAGLTIWFNVGGSGFQDGSVGTAGTVEREAAKEERP